MEYRPIPISTRRVYAQNIPVGNGQTSDSYNAAACRSGMKWSHSSSSPNKMMHISQSPTIVPMNTGGLILNNAEAMQQHLSFESSQMIDMVAEEPYENRYTKQTLKSTTACRPLTLIILITAGLALLTIAIALPMTASWTQSRSAFVRFTTVEMQEGSKDGSNVKTLTSHPSESNQLGAVSTVAAAAMSSLTSISSLITTTDASTASSSSSPPSSFVSPPPPPAASGTIRASATQPGTDTRLQTVGHSMQIAEEVLAAVSANTVCEEVLNVVRFRTGLTTVLFKRNSLPMHQLINLDRPIMISVNGMISPYYSNIRFANLTALKLYSKLVDCSRDASLRQQTIKNLTCASPGISFRLTCAQVDSEETVECALRASAGCVSSAESRVQSSTSYNRLRSDWVLWCSVTTLL
jgi:hypothetical protein